MSQITTNYETNKIAQWGLLKDRSTDICGGELRFLTEFKTRWRRCWQDQRSSTTQVKDNIDKTMKTFIDTVQETDDKWLTNLNQCSWYEDQHTPLDTYRRNQSSCNHPSEVDTLSISESEGGREGVREEDRERNREREWEEKEERERERKRGREGGSIYIYKRGREREWVCVRERDRQDTWPQTHDDQNFRRWEEKERDREGEREREREIEQVTHSSGSSFSLFTCGSLSLSVSLSLSSVTVQNYQCQSNTRLYQGKKKDSHNNTHMLVNTNPSTHKEI